MSQTVFALHEESGQVAEIDAEWLDHPTFGPVLRQMRTGKPLVDLGKASETPAPTDRPPVDPSSGDTNPDEDVE